MKTIMEQIPVLLVYLSCTLIPLIVYALIEVFIVRTKIGQRFERWLFKKLGIDPDIK